MTGVDGNHPRCSVLQQTIRKTARGGSDVETDFALNLDAPMLNRFFELETSATDILQVFAQKTNVSFRVYSRAGFFYFLSADQNLPCQDQRLRPFTRTCESAFQQQLVEPDFQIVSIEFCNSSLQLTTKVPATNSVQGVEASLAELVTKILPPFSTVFSTKVLKSVMQHSSVPDRKPNGSTKTAFDSMALSCHVH